MNVPLIRMLPAQCERRKIDGRLFGRFELRNPPAAKEIGPECSREGTQRKSLGASSASGEASWASASLGNRLFASERHKARILRGSDSAGYLSDCGGILEIRRSEVSGDTLKPGRRRARLSAELAKSIICHAHLGLATIDRFIRDNHRATKLDALHTVHPTTISSMYDKHGAHGIRSQLHQRQVAGMMHELFKAPPLMQLESSI
ncbi:hypothetical protein A0H81_03555 [Grifola frondosa]|uniref:Uncharacterized protein n=1 Tax=Grifola frondosa TaxID=5627 RepID=A0A1C7MI14_GRIFR|nr:hypothetical protein A0H81_03555 [Grifola frondosa]